MRCSWLLYFLPLFCNFFCWKSWRLKSSFQFQFFVLWCRKFRNEIKWILDFFWKFYIFRFKKNNIFRRKNITKVFLWNCFLEKKYQKSFSNLLFFQKQFFFVFSNKTKQKSVKFFKVTFLFQNIFFFKNFFLFFEQKNQKSFSHKFTLLPFLEFFAS